MLETVLKVPHPSFPLLTPPLSRGIYALDRWQVRYLKIMEKSGYQALPWVRYITQNGDYQLRTT